MAIRNPIYSKLVANQLVHIPDGSNTMYRCFIGKMNARSTDFAKVEKFNEISFTGSYQMAIEDLTGTSDHTTACGLFHSPTIAPSHVFFFAGRASGVTHVFKMHTSTDVR